MRGHGGFEHNRQSLRVVEELEQKYPRFPGLNLSWEVREGLAKHETGYDRPGPGLGFDARCSSLEAQVANLADEIAYYSHDLDDGLDARLLSEKSLTRDVRVWRLAAQKVRRLHGSLPDEVRWYFTIRCIIDDQVHDVVESTEKRLAAAGVASADAVRRQRRPLVAYSPDRRRLNLELRKYLYRQLYYSEAVHVPNSRATEMLGALFEFYLKQPVEMGEQARRRIPRDGLTRAVCDYLAGMTDRYALGEYERLIGRKATGT
jgi:dGTPase